VTTTDWPDFDDVIDPETVPVPGSRPRVQHVRKEVEPRPVAQWDAHPKIYRVNGQDLELFGVAALAMALGRTTSSIKHWEREGWLPKTSLRLPMNLRSGIKTKDWVRGMPVGGRRLYTRAFIERIKALAEEIGVDRLGVYVSETEFPQRAFEIYAETMPGEPA